MTKAELRYLMAIDMLYDGISGVKLTEIAAEMAVTKVSVYRAMERLEGNGYIERNEKNKVILTEKGKKTVDDYRIIVDFVLLQFKRYCDLPPELVYQDALGVATSLGKEICAFISEYQTGSMKQKKADSK